MKKSYTFYICSTAWDHEIFGTPVTLYKDIKSLKRKAKCWKECGITKVTFSGKSIVKGKMLDRK